MKKLISMIVLCLLTACTFGVRAEVKVAEVFSSHMVLQREKAVKVWGTADADGRWMVELNPMKATAKPQTMTISGKKNRVVLKNLLVGEVWLASGQSNMEYSMNAHPKYAKPQKGDSDYLKHEWEKAKNPHIRLLYIEKNLNCDTLPTHGWQMVTQESLTPFSAAAWFFAEMLQDSLQVPVGIITSAWGGTYIEDWMDGDTDIYTQKQQHLVNQWRKAFRDDSLPFYYVQISPFIYSTRRELVAKTWLDLPRFWDAQTRCMDVISNSGMVVTTDIPENLNDIHPPYKWVVGFRLARWALHDVYDYHR